MNRGQDGERRSRPRAETLGRALIMLDDENAVGYRVDNLSAGGALLSDGPPLRLWETYRLVLLLEGLPAIEVKARAVWHTEEEPPRFGLSFEHPDAMLQDVIHDVVLGILSGAQPIAAPVTGEKLPSWLM